MNKEKEKEKENTITNNIINQCLNLLSIKNDLLKSNIIDPLVGYLKQKLQTLYIILLGLLSLILLTNIIILYKVFSFT